MVSLSASDVDVAEISADEAECEGAASASSAGDSVKNLLWGTGIVDPQNDRHTLKSSIP